MRKWREFKSSLLHFSKYINIFSRECRLLLLLRLPFFSRFNFPVIGFCCFFTFDCLFPWYVYAAAAAWNKQFRAHRLACRFYCLEWLCANMQRHHRFTLTMTTLKLRRRRRLLENMKAYTAKMYRYRHGCEERFNFTSSRKYIYIHIQYMGDPIYVTCTLRTSASDCF